MNSRRLKKELAGYFQRSDIPQAEAGRIDETAARCKAVMGAWPARASEPRQSFWGFLADVFHFEGIPILASQLVVLLAACLAALSSRMGVYEVPMYMPLFILAVMPAFFRGQHYRMSEIEAATRTSGALLTLARLVLAGGGALVCLTFLLALEVWLQRSCENLGRMVIYCLVPYLTCMTAMLALIRRRKRDGASLCLTIALGSVFFWRYCSYLFPWLYEASALGVWVAAVLVYSWLFARELAYIIRASKRVDMYGIVG